MYKYIQIKGNLYGRSDLKLLNISAVKIKSSNLGTVEDPLKVNSLRPLNCRHKGGSPYHLSSELNSKIAIRGWVYQLEIIPDHEGPDYHFLIAWIFNNILYHKKFKVGYDLYHWQWGTPDHYKWFHSTIIPGKALTLMVDPENHHEANIFGQYEAFLKKNGKLQWIAH